MLYTTTTIEMTGLRCAAVETDIMVEDVARARRSYLDILEKILCNTIYCDGSILKNTEYGTFDPQNRALGLDWPERAHTMIGLTRLRHLRQCVERVLEDRVAGDLIEAGVWRGGASIMMRAVLDVYGVDDRLVWVADSFNGLPPANPDKYPEDVNMHFSSFQELAIPMESVRENFARYGLLDDSVRFVKGLFSETLHTIESEAFAVIRLDGDLYESTIDSLKALYPKLSPGGFAIIDDYGSFPACRAAVRDYRQSYDIDEPIEGIDWTGVFWRKRAK